VHLSRVQKTTASNNANVPAGSNPTHVVTIACCYLSTWVSTLAANTNQSTRHLHFRQGPEASIASPNHSPVPHSVS